MIKVRFRTLGDLTITGAFESDAETIEAIIDEVAATRITERGLVEWMTREVLALWRIEKRRIFLMSASSTHHNGLLRFTTAGSVDDGKRL